MARSKQAGSEKISSLLSQGHFGSPDRQLPENDPVTPTQMIVRVDEIRPYDRNPRRVRNDKYDRIKESIRAQRQITSTLEITRRPGEELYMVRAGGNTRLQILQDLYRETQDDAFAHVHCIFHPWTGEVHVLTAHLVENELRGDLTFIDKALGLSSLRRQLEEETGTVLSRNQFLIKAAELGYSVSKPLHVLLEYAADQLHPLIPMALDSGMGKPQVERIRRLENACAEFYAHYQGVEYSNETQNDIRDLFWGPLLHRLDSEDLDAALVRQELEEALTQQFGIDIRRVRLELDGLMHPARDRRSSVLGALGMSDDDEHNDDAEAYRDTADDAVKETPPAEPAQHAPTVRRERTTSPTEDDLPESENVPAIDPEPDRDTTPPHDINASDNASSISPAYEEPDLSAAPEAAPRETESPSTLDQTMERPEHLTTNDLKSLRSRAYVLALRIAQRQRLQKLVRPLPYQGLGWCMELPDEPFEQTGLARLVWWVLLSLSESAVFATRTERLPADHQLRHLILAEDLEGIFAIASDPPPISELSAQLINNPELPQDDFEDLFALAATCRRTRKEAGDDEQRLWGEA